MRLLFPRKGQVSNGQAKFHDWRRKMLSCFKTNTVLITNVDIYPYRH